MLKLYDCVISRRGKGAKGTIKVKTLGIPFSNVDGVAKDWSYSDIGHNLENFIRNVKETLGNMIDVSDSQLIIDCCKGIDMRLKSDTAKEQNEQSLLANRLIALELATDKAESLTLAKSMLVNIKAIVAAGYDNFDGATEKQLEIRRGIVASLKAKGAFRSSRLVDNRPKVEATDEIVIDENDDDSDDDN